MQYEILAFVLTSSTSDTEQPSITHHVWIPTPKDQKEEE